MLTNVMEENPQQAAAPYMPESARELYADILAAYAGAADCQELYRQMAHIFVHILDENTSTEHVTLVGPFAKTDYLLKRGHASKRLHQMVNDLRVRLLRMHGEELPEATLLLTRADDLQALCLFVSHIYGEPVPQALESQFPARRRRRSGKLLFGEQARMMVEKWDAQYIYGVLEQDATRGAKVLYASPDDNPARSYAYLEKLLSKGTQLNLVRPRLADGIIHAELIILEPDYLVDISQVARCMDEYADSPLVYLLHQLEPQPQSEALMLGNLAGQMLDEELHNVSTDCNYADSARAFFRHYSLSLAAMPVGAPFHDEGRRQQRHIRRAIREDLPGLIGEFNAGHVMVEPSFFSQMLGLQGRMDFLQLDHRLVIEQKAGKGAFVCNDPEPGVPKVQRTHYVQLLLYMAVLKYNYRQQYEANNEELHAFLLYSKYANPLLGLGFAPELLHHALELRNQLVWHQLRLADGGYEILGSLTPERMNSRNCQSRLWTDYKLPQIEALLSPVRGASPVERAYFYRMMAFVSREHTLSKLGNQSKENSGFASTWLSSLEEKLATGNIYHRLRLSSPEATAAGRVDEVVLDFCERESNDMSNFRPGDIVILYSYEPERTPDATKSMVFRCSVVDIGVDSIRLSLRQAQVDAYVFTRHSHLPWAIEHDFFESSSSSLYRGVYAFLCAPQSRRGLLMMQRRPEVDKSLEIMGEYGSFNTLAQRVLQARELFLIIGPPGTGKTSFGMLDTLREELLHDGAEVLLMSYTNRAVDEICSKLDGVTDYIRIGNALACPPQYRSHLLDERVKDCANVAQVRELFMQTHVFVGTTTAFNSALQLFQLKQFSLAIVDEASQILEPHLMGLFSATHEGEPAIRKFVMIGDHKQLPAVVQQREDESEVNSPLLHGIGLHNCRLSLFERLLSRYGNDPEVTYMLTRQGRMHEDIAAFPNMMFYGGLLQTVPLPHQTAPLPDIPDDADATTRLLLSRRVLFLPCDAPKDSPSDKVNQPEADIIADLVLHIYALEKEHGGFSPDETVGIIVPYRNQIATIRNTLDKSGIPALHDIAIDTVERYQGSQRKYIIYGFTIQKHYQLKFLTGNTFVDDTGAMIDRKLNVAMTRAQEHLIMVGNPALLDLNPIFRKLYTSYM